MALRNIDSDAYSADENLHSAVLTLIREMGEAAWDDCPRGCGALWDLRDAPILFSVPRGNTADVVTASDRGYKIFLWRAVQGESGLDVTTLTEAYQSNVTLSLHCSTLRDFIRHRRVPPALTSWTITPGSETLSEKGFNYDFVAGEVYAVILSASTAALGSPVEVWTNSAVGEVSTLAGWAKAAPYADRTPTFWKEAGSTWVTHTEKKEPYLVEIVSESGDPHQDGYEAGKSSGPPSPTGRLARAHFRSNPFVAIGVRDVVHVWPPLDPTYTENQYSAILSASSVFVRRTPIGYIELRNVNFRARNQSLNPILSALAPDKPASASAVRAACRSAIDTVALRQQVYAIAPSPDYDDESSRTPATATDYCFKQRSRVVLPLTTSYQTLQDIVVGAPGAYEVGGVTYYKSVYHVTLLGFVIAYNGDAAGLEAELAFQMAVTSLTGGTTGTATEVLASGCHVMSEPGINNPRPNAHFWLHGYPRDPSDYAPSEMCTNDMWCDAAWRTSSPISVSAVVRDDNAVNDGAERKLEIELKYISENSNFPTARAWFVLDALTVTAVEGLDPSSGEE